MIRRFQVYWYLPRDKTVTYRATPATSLATATLQGEVSPRPPSARCHVMRLRTCLASPFHPRRMQTRKCPSLTPRRATSRATLATCPIFSTRWVVRSANARRSAPAGTLASSMACARRPRASPWCPLPSTSHLCQAAVNSGFVAVLGCFGWFDCSLAQNNRKFVHGSPVCCILCRGHQHNTNYSTDA